MPASLTLYFKDNIIKQPAESQAVYRVNRIFVISIKYNKHADIPRLYRRRVL